MVNPTSLAMSWEEWHKHDAVALSSRVRANEVTAKELCAQAVEAIERLDPVIEAVLGIYEDAVTDPDRDGPSKTGQLYGIPMLLKDLGSGLAGRTQESGSRMFKDHVVKATDPLVANYLRAGLIPVGRSTTPEFGMTFDTTTVISAGSKSRAIRGIRSEHRAARPRRLPPGCCRSACPPTAAG